MHSVFLVFVSGYLSVFLLGFQSRLVNTENYLWSAACSFTIALSQAKLWGTLMKPDSHIENTIAYGFAGSCAICSAIYVHKKFFTKKVDVI